MNCCTYVGLHRYLGCCYLPAVTLLKDNLSKVAQGGGMRLDYQYWIGVRNVQMANIKIEKARRLAKSVCLGQSLPATDHYAYFVNLGRWQWGSVCLTCPQGTYPNEIGFHGPCKDCLAEDTWCLEWLLSMTISDWRMPNIHIFSPCEAYENCYPCVTAREPGSSVCSCARGTFSGHNNTCIACPLGFFSDKDNSRFSNMPKGYYGNQYTTRHVPCMCTWKVWDLCWISCVKCKAGNCSAGRYSDTDGTTKTCKDCPKGNIILNMGLMKSQFAKCALLESMTQAILVYLR